MNTRIKTLRKELGLNQTDFGEKVGLSRDTVANIEGGRIEIRDVFIIAICNTFNVREEWLRNGAGEIFKTQGTDKFSRNESIATFINDVMKDEEDSFRRKFIEVLSVLEPEHWHLLSDFMNKLVAENQPEDSGNESSNVTTIPTPYDISPGESEIIKKPKDGKETA